MLEASEFSGHRLNETQLLHEAIELLAGGVLPTNTTACYAIYFLLTHSQALATLKSELAGLPKNADGIPRFKTSTDASASYLVCHPSFYSRSVGLTLVLDCCRQRNPSAPPGCRTWVSTQSCNFERNLHWRHIYSWRSETTDSRKSLIVKANIPTRPSYLQAFFPSAPTKLSSKIR
jgi:hypothetical protein